jgi:hypothetical protein
MAPKAVKRTELSESRDWSQSIAIETVSVNSLWTVNRPTVIANNIRSITVHPTVLANTSSTIT